jgi:hypothetical protein
MVVIIATGGLPNISFQEKLEMKTTILNGNPNADNAAFKNYLPKF